MVEMDRRMDAWTEEQTSRGWRLRHLSNNAARCIRSLGGGVSQGTSCSTALPLRSRPYLPRFSQLQEVTKVCR